MEKDKIPRQLKYWHKQYALNPEPEKERLRLYWWVKHYKFTKDDAKKMDKITRQMKKYYYTDKYYLLLKEQKRILINKYRNGTNNNKPEN